MIAAENEVLRQERDDARRDASQAQRTLALVKNDLQAMKDTTRRELQRANVVWTGGLDNALRRARERISRLKQQSDRHRDAAATITNLKKKWGGDFESRVNDAMQRARVAQQKVADLAAARAAHRLERGKLQHEASNLRYKLEEARNDIAANRHVAAMAELRAARSFGEQAEAAKDRMRSLEAALHEVSRERDALLDVAANFTTELDDAVDDAGVELQATALPPSCTSTEATICPTMEKNKAR